MKKCNKKYCECGNKIVFPVFMKKPYQTKWKWDKKHCVCYRCFRKSKANGQKMTLQNSTKMIRI